MQVSVWAKGLLALRNAHAADRRWVFGSEQAVSGLPLQAAGHVASSAKGRF